jgi:hypothetical protein
MTDLTMWVSSLTVILLVFLAVVVRLDRGTDE